MICRDQYGQTTYALETGAHTVYALQYHFVAVTKYRADLLTDESSDRVGEIVNDIAEDFGVNIQNGNGGSDRQNRRIWRRRPTGIPRAWEASPSSGDA